MAKANPADDDGKFFVKNVSRRTRVFYDSSNKMVSLEPGQSVVVFLSERASNSMKHSETLHLEKAGEDETVSTNPVEDKDDDRGDFIASSAQELLDKIKSEKLKYNDYYATAKHILGDDWPGGGAAGGNPKSPAIMSALRKKASEE